MYSLFYLCWKLWNCLVILDENIDETYGINVQFEESEEEVCVTTGLSSYWWNQCGFWCASYFVALMQITLLGSRFRTDIYCAFVINLSFII